jgi:hypothetical protein
MDPSKREEVYSLIRNWIDQDTEAENIQDVQHAIPVEMLTGDQGAPLAKIPRFRDYEDSSDSETEDSEQKHELDRYLEMPTPKGKGTNEYFVVQNKFQ